MNAVSSIYEGFASNYDATRFDCTCGSLQNEIETRIVLRLLGKSRKILDAGAGTGRFAIAIAGILGTVVAVDASRSMVTIAKRRAENLGIMDKISFVQADVRHLPFKSSSFNSVVSIRILSHYRVVRPILAEYHRVLKQNGDMILDAANRFASVYRRLVPEVNKDSAPDFFHTIAEIGREMTSQRTRLRAVKRYAILPPMVLHRTLCRRYQTRARAVLRNILQTRIGFLTIIHGVKQS